MSSAAADVNHLPFSLRSGISISAGIYSHLTHSCVVDLICGSGTMCLLFKGRSHPVAVGTRMKLMSRLFRRLSSCRRVLVDISRCALFSDQRNVASIWLPQLFHVWPQS